VQLFGVPLHRWCLFAFVVLLVLTTVAMLIEMPPPGDGWPHWDKVQHATIFLCLTGLGLLALEGAAMHVVSGLIFYGVLTEIMQHLLTYTRMGSIYDWLADVLGIVLAWFVFILFNRYLFRV
jgi:VanZ family protein